MIGRGFAPWMWACISIFIQLHLYRHFFVFFPFIGGHYLVFALFFGIIIIAGSLGSSSLFFYFQYSGSWIFSHQHIDSHIGGIGLKASGRLIGQLNILSTDLHMTQQWGSPFERLDCHTNIDLHISNTYRNINIHHWICATFAITNIMGCI
jgi:hypothetical protein